VNDALTESTNHSFCDIPGICKDKDMERLRKIKEFLNARLQQLGREGKEPTMVELFAEIEEKTGIDEEVAEGLIEVSILSHSCPRTMCSICRYLQSPR